MFVKLVMWRQMVVDGVLGWLMALGLLWCDSRPGKQTSCSVKVLELRRG